uniref:Nicastrin n=1 Tax=Heterorhabditis bacteriophora TaxID=37862 RepID=A0A1I7WEZ8_HETBA
MNGSEVVHFFMPPIPLDCDKKFMKNWVYIDYQGKIAFDEKRSSAKCTISYFDRKDDQSNVFIKFDSISSGDKMASDFAVVHCNDRSENWSGLLMSVSEKKGLRHSLKQIGSTTNSSGLDVFFLGFDSLSQMSFRRNLPKTVEFLENVLESVILNGYNIVGDGTPQAFIPILTGKTEIELPLTRYHSVFVFSNFLMFNSHFRKRFSAANYVDDVYPFIWRNFSDAGYVTGYGEDAYRIGRSIIVFLKFNIHTLMYYGNFLKIYLSGVFCNSILMLLFVRCYTIYSQQGKNSAEACKSICSVLGETCRVKLIPNTGLLKYKNVKDNDGFVPDLSGSTTAAFAHYQLKIRTKPGTATYEVTLFYDSIAKSVHIDLSSVSHVNKFGDDPHCIIDKNYFLATYCVCYDRI